MTLWMSLRNDIVSFWFWGYRGHLRTELQAPVLSLSQSDDGHKSLHNSSVFKHLFKVSRWNSFNMAKI